MTTVDEGACKVWSSNALRFIRHFTSMWKSFKDRILNISYIDIQNVDYLRYLDSLALPISYLFVKGICIYIIQTPPKRARPLPSIGEVAQQKTIWGTWRVPAIKKTCHVRDWQRVSPFFLWQVSRLVSTSCNSSSSVSPSLSWLKWRGDDRLHGGSRP